MRSLNRLDQYESIAWNIIEYVSLFGIVLLHEFGHALACRQVGGQASRIMLWPLGGVAFVQPPNRPGALLWSIVAGPLVNVVLVPVSILAILGLTWTGWEIVYPDFARFLMSVTIMNLVLLVFNLAPVYPLDGGQILQALLWYVVGRARSLMIAGVIGLAGAAAMIGYALVRLEDPWLALIAFFVAWQAWNGFRLGGQLHSLQPTIALLTEGLLAVKAGKPYEAIECFSKVIDAGGKPEVVATALLNRGLAQSNLGQWQAAVDDYTEALRLQPKSVGPRNNLAWLQATCPADSMRNGQEALEHATWACKATGWSNPTCMGTYAAACAETGDFSQALQWQKRAAADAGYRKTYGEETIAARLQLYEQGLPYRIENVEGEPKPLDGSADGTSDPAKTTQSA